MAREAFPFASDRDVILAFLAQGRHGPRKSDWLDWSGKVLKFSDGVTVAWFGPDGSLQAKIAPGIGATYSMRTVNYIMDELGDAESRVTREGPSVFTSPPDPAGGTRWFFGSQPVAPDEPFTLAGPVGLLAYRAETKAETKATTKAEA